MVEMAWDLVAWLFIGPWWMLGTFAVMVVIGHLFDPDGKGPRP